MTSSVTSKFAATCAVLGLATVGITATARPANAWWSPYWYGPPVVVAPPPPPYYAPPPVYYAPPAPRAWIPAHWQNGYWIPGHWV